MFTLFRKYFIPTLLGMLSISAVTAIDGIFVGRGVGSDGIASVNITIPLLMFFTGVGLMIGAGCSVVASMRLAVGDVAAARMNVAHALIFATVVVGGSTAVMMAFPEATLRMLGASDYLLPMAKDYLMWFVPSWVFQVWISISLFIIRLDGAPKFAMTCSLITAVINIVLDWLFIFPFGWGVMGAAFATSISIVVGGIMAIVYLLSFAGKLRLSIVKLGRGELLSMLRNVGHQCKIGSSALLAEATLATLMFMGNHIFMRYMGEDGVGAFGIACYYAPFVFMVGNAIAQSAQPIISYNFGIGAMKRVSDTKKIVLVTSTICGIVVTGLFVAFPNMLVELFVGDTGSDAARIAIEGFPYFSAGFVFFIINLSIIGYYQSIERVKPATVYALFRGMLFLVPCFLLLPVAFGNCGIWLAMPLSEILTTTVILVVVLFNKKMCNIFR